jgi:hypothetical protein
MSIVVFLELLVANTLCAALGVPTVTLPKLRLFVLRFRCAFPFPGFLAKAGVDVTSPIAKSRAKLRTEKAKRDGFGRDMSIPPKIVAHERISEPRTVTTPAPTKNLRISCPIGNPAVQPSPHSESYPRYSKDEVMCKHDILGRDTRGNM